MMSLLNFFLESKSRNHGIRNEIPGFVCFRSRAHNGLKPKAPFSGTWNSTRTWELYIELNASPKEWNSSGIPMEFHGNSYSIPPACYHPDKPGGGRTSCPSRPMKIVCYLSNASMLLAKNWLDLFCINLAYTCILEGLHNFSYFPPFLSISERDSAPR